MKTSALDMTEQFILAWCDENDLLSSFGQAAERPHWVEEWSCEAVRLKMEQAGEDADTADLSFDLDVSISSVSSPFDVVLEVVQTVPALMSTQEGFLMTQVNAVKDFLYPVVEFGADLLTKAVLPMQKMALQAKDLITTVVDMIGIVNPYMDAGKRAFALVDTMKTAVRSMDSGLHDAGIPALGRIIGQIARRALSDPECAVGYLIPRDFPVFIRDVVSVSSK